MDMQRFKKIILSLLALTVIISAAGIPFFFESMSMNYKIGIDKLLLRSGKVFGMIAYILIFFQPFFIARLSFLNNSFSLKQYFSIHKKNGLIILVAALFHPLLILWADHFSFFTFEIRYWPEFMGVGLLVLLIFFISISFFRDLIKMSFKTWQKTHRFLAPIIMAMMFLHVFNVSDSFESQFPFYFLLATGFISGLLFIRFYLPRLFNKEK